MADRAAELHGGWLWTRGGGASPRGETWRRRWFTLVKDGRRAVLEFRAAQTSPKPLARLALTPSSECIRLVGADARRAANGRNCPAGVVLRFSVGGVTRLARASSDSAAEGWIAAVAQAAAAVVASPSTRRASDVDGELARLSARRREMERVEAALRAKSDRLDRRVRALRDVVSPAPSPPRKPPEPPGYVVATPAQLPAPPDDGEAERAADVAAAAALCARTEAAARDVASRTAELADAERALSARLDAASADVPDDGGGDDDAPFAASTLLEALEVLAARKGVLVSRARGERRPPSRVEGAWLETLRAEVALLEEYCLSVFSFPRRLHCEKPLEKARFADAHASRGVRTYQ